MWTAFLIIILSLVHSYNWLAVIICLIVQDLAKKFNETTQYKNMKQMLTSKNDQIKELRGRLRKWVIENRSCYFLLWSWKALILLAFLIFSMALSPSKLKYNITNKKVYHIWKISEEFQETLLRFGNRARICTMLLILSWNWAS